MVSIGFLIGFIAAYWVYTDARRRGRDMGSTLLWSIGTLAMVFVVLPLYLILGRKPQLKKRSDPDIIDIEATVINDNYSSCTMCGGKVKDEFNVCPYCGFTLRPKCHNCGQPLRRDERTCPSCQTPANPK